MNDRIIAVTFPKCRTCVYAQEFKSNMADCFGHPPSVHVIGMSPPDALGRPGIQLETFVPRVNQDRAACALYKQKLDFSTSGKS